MSRNRQDKQEAKSPTTDAEIAAALQAARLREEQEGPDPYATGIEYLEAAHILVVRLNNGLRLAMPVENLQGLENATAEQLHRYELHGRGYGFGFQDLDASFYIDGLLEGIYGSPQWMTHLHACGLSPQRSSLQAGKSGARRTRKERIPA